MSARSRKSRREISPDTPNATSSRATRAGRSRSAPPGGQTKDRSGRAPVPASPSPQPEATKALPIRGTFGQTFIDSLATSGHLLSWESRLRAALATVGSTEFNLIWKRKTTPAGRLISRLAVSMRHTAGTVSSGSRRISVPRPISAWMTPLANDAKSGRLSRWHRRKGSNSLNDAAVGIAIVEKMRLAGWPTPTSLSFDKSHQPGNSRNLTAIRHIGIAATGITSPSSAPIPMESADVSASLNPRFVAWLMGVPVAVLECAPRSRSSHGKTTDL